MAHLGTHPRYSQWGSFLSSPCPGKASLGYSYSLFSGACPLLYDGVCVSKPLTFWVFL